MVTISGAWRPSWILCPGPLVQATVFKLQGRVKKENVDFLTLFHFAHKRFSLKLIDFFENQNKRYFFEKIRHFEY